MSFVAASVHRAWTITSAPAIPAGTQMGDVMVAVLGGSTSRTISAAPPGWTLISASDGGGHTYARLYFYAKVATASETAPIWTWSETHWSYAVILTYRDVVMPNTANVAADLAVPGTTQAVPGVTTQNDNATVIWVGYWHNNGEASSGFDGTYTVRHRYEGTGAGLVIGEEVRATAGPTGGRTLTIAPGTGWLVAGSLALEPGSAPVDETDPTVSIDAVHGDGHAESIYDASGYDPETDTLTVTGNAADEGGSGLVLVEVRVDGGAWQAATGTTSWSYRFDVSGWTPGQHTIEARSTDGAGNVSAIDSVTVWHSPSGMWGASASGEGHLIPVYAGVRVFSPLDLPGLRLWLDAADLSTITESNGAISQWDDKSPQGSAATQGTAVYQPQLVLNELNGLPIVRFVEDSLEVNDPGIFSDAAVGTVFAVVKQVGNSAVRQYILGVSSSNTTLTRFGAMGRESSQDRLAVVGRRLDGDSAQFVVPSSVGHEHKWRVATWEIAWVDAFARVRQDGVDITSTASFLTAGRTSNTNSQVQISALATTRNTVDIAELLVFRTEARLSASQVAQVEKYLAQKWGLTLS